MKNRNNGRRFRDLATQALNALEKPETNKGLTKQIATRSQSIDFISTVLGGLPNPDPVLKKLGRSIQVYEALEFDSRVIACTQSRKSAVKAMEWDITNEKTPQAQIDFHKEYFDLYCQAPNKIGDMISELLDAWLYGYKPFEIMWATDGSKVIPERFIGKPSRWFKYGDQNELRFISRASMTQGEEVPLDKFIVARREPTYDNPYGKPVLSACFWPVTFRKNGFKFWTIFVEKYGMPFLLAKAPEGEREGRILEVADMLQDMVLDAIAVVPKEYEVELVEAATGGAKGQNPAHKVYLDTMNVEIAMAILGTNLTTEVQGGSYAAAQSHMSVRDDIVEGDAKIVEGAFNELIAITHRLNFGDTPPPTFHMFAEEKVDEVRSKRDLNLKNTGVKFTSEYYQRAYNLNEDDFEITEPVEVPAFAPGQEGGDDE